MTALARWRRMKMEEERGPEERRPALASECTDVKKAEKWRLEIIREIGKKIAQIQNPGLGEFKIRDLNDEINKFLRTKYHWEVRIKELGGPDYKRIAPKMLDREGREVPGNRGYKYFGAAKDLPGVRELFEKPQRDDHKKTRGELQRFVDADYYGYMDDDDGILIPLEQAEEQKAVARAMEEWRKNKEAGVTAAVGQVAEDEKDIYDVGDVGNNDDAMDTDFPSVMAGTSEIGEEFGSRFIAPVAVPSQKDVEEALVKRRKAELMEKYASESLVQQFKEARTLMGYESEIALKNTTAPSDSDSEVVEIP